jgi:hypothetical protein
MKGSRCLQVVKVLTDSISDKYSPKVVFDLISSFSTKYRKHAHKSGKNRLFQSAPSWAGSPVVCGPVM